MQRIALGLLAALWLSAPRWASGEIFELENGGRIEGDVLNPKESPRKRYVIKTTAGARMTLDKAQVKEVIHRAANDIEYEKVRPRYPDTVDGQWDLAEWCRQRHLERLRARHLERIIELDEDHEKARQALHYRRVGGQWKTQKQEMEEQGYVSYKGKWRTSQEVLIKERKRKAELAIKEWKGRLKRWRGWLDSGRAAEATQQIDAINDPFAIPALEEALRHDEMEANRKRYIAALARIGSPSAWQVLCEHAVEDENSEVRLTCLDHLEEHPSGAFVEYFTSRLNDKNNPIVNRAAMGLARMKSPAAISPLIDHLITVHKYVVNPGSGGIGGTFFNGSNGSSGGGLSVGSSPPTVVAQPHQNEDVLDALIKLADGANFSYDVPAWKSWYAGRKKAQSLNGRRDDD
ncbi:MAG TPA: HEAT repeat domain-containing protein [Pirellulales bacterium]|nr:HEAT repeat domain-containing protein [Pirellulales bacterium]